MRRADIFYSSTTRYCLSSTLGLQRRSNDETVNHGISTWCFVVSAPPPTPSVSLNLFLCKSYYSAGNVLLTTSRARIRISGKSVVSAWVSWIAFVSCKVVCPISGAFFPFSKIYTKFIVSISRPDASAQLTHTRRPVTIVPTTETDCGLSLLQCTVLLGNWIFAVSGLWHLVRGACGRFFGAYFAV